MLMTAIAAAAAATSAPPAARAPTSATPTAASAPADSQGDTLARSVLDTIAAGDEARTRAFFAASSAPTAPEAERSLALLLALTRQSGGIELTGWHPDGERFFFEGRTRAQGIGVQGMIHVQGSRIVAFDVQRNPLDRGDGAPPWPPAAVSSAEAVKAIASELDWRARSERFSGAVLVAHRGTPVLERAYGLASRGPDIAATPSTLFGTASATKMLTSVAVARLVDRGKLAFDTKVSVAVPALAVIPGADSVTIRDLLGHRVSWGEYFSETEQDPRIASHKQAAELLPLLPREGPKRAPAGRISYSNGNYLVLAAAVEEASGKSFYAFVEDEILRPVGMSKTGYGTGTRPASMALGWIKDEVADPLGIGPWKSNEGRNGGPRGGPAGGAFTTARDMWLFLEALASGKLVRPQTLRSMWEDRVRVGSKLGAATGFMFRGGESPAFFGHSGGGGNAGVSTAAYTTPDREWTVVVLSNFSSPAGEMLGNQIMDYLASLPRAEGAAQNKVVSQ